MNIKKGNIKFLIKEGEKEIVREVQSTETKFDHWEDQIDLTGICRTFYPTTESIHSFQLHMEPSLGYNIYGVRNKS